jgi:hypothetical protein
MLIFHGHTRNHRKREDQLKRGRKPLSNNELMAKLQINLF